MQALLDCIRKLFGLKGLRDLAGTAAVLTLLPSLAFGAASHVVRDPDLRTVRQAKLRPLRWASPVAARYRFESTGGDWPTPVAPTIDCRLSAWSSGTLDCGGATFTPSGSPTAGVPTYWRPAGGAAGAGVGFDGDDSFSTVNPSPFAPTVTATGVVRFTSSSATGERFLAQIPGVFRIRAYNLTILIDVYKAGGSSSTISVGGISQNGTNVLAWAYEYVADGTSIIRANLNGMAVSLSNAVGPLPAPAAAMSLGSAWVGSVSGPQFWSGWAASASELARLVRSQYAAQGSLGEPLTVTGPATSAVLTRADGSPYLATVPANQPSIVEGGVQVYPARFNYLLQSETIPTGVTVNTTPWLTNATDAVTTTADQADSPAGTKTADLVVFPASANAVLKQQIATTASTTYTLSAWVWTDSGSRSFRLWRNNVASWASASVSPTLSATTVPQRFSLTFTTLVGETASNIGIGGEIKTPFTPTAGNYFVWGWQLEQGAVATPYAATAASPLSVAATSLAAGHGIVGNSWCVRARVTISGLWSTAGIARPIFALGTLGASNSSGFGTGADTYLYFHVIDGAGVNRGVIATGAQVTGLPSSATLVACNTSGALSIYANGTQLTTSTYAATGTGLWSVPPATAYLGSSSSGGERLTGSVSSIVFCNTSIPEECQ